MMLTLTTGPSQTSLQSECYREGILGAVLGENQADNVHRGDKEFLDAPCSVTLGYPSSFAAEFLQ